MIVSYCQWTKHPIPFTTYYNKHTWARTQDVRSIVKKEQRFMSTRTHNKTFYTELGSLHISDNGIRAQIVTDPRLLHTWLHNPCSVAAALLNNQPAFNAYVNSRKFGANLDPRYSIDYLYGEFQKSLDSRALIMAA
ncbi:hypothetical protein [Scytonema sp. NUACC26]|uniref:hypothetical protein n=1 Tax=Scytonema sp. NUACC26 TaxID=3140176 RepID=UPI0038B2F18A